MKATTESQYDRHQTLTQHESEEKSIFRIYGPELGSTIYIRSVSVDRKWVSEKNDSFSKNLIYFMSTWHAIPLFSPSRKYGFMCLYYCVVEIKYFNSHFFFHTNHNVDGTIHLPQYAGRIVISVCQSGRGEKVKVVIMYYNNKSEVKLFYFIISLFVAEEYGNCCNNRATRCISATTNYIILSKEKTLKVESF